MDSTESTMAGAVMSSPVRTIEPTATIEDAQKLLLRYGHSGLCVVKCDRSLVGIITRRDIETSLRHGLGGSCVSNFMSREVKTADPEMSLAQVQHMMSAYDLGRIPVVSSGELVGILTRSDLLRQFNRSNPVAISARKLPTREDVSHQLATLLPDTWPILIDLADIASQKGWSLYIVGGAVRDLLLGFLAARADALTLKDIDLVVEGVGTGVGAGVALAEAIQFRYSGVALQTYGQFQTASLRWKTAAGEPLVLDIATARTEFYPYPAANPEVEASGLQQDLYRRDFTINAIAICLTAPPAGSPNSASNSSQERGRIVDFFNGWSDLQKRQVRVLHNNSFIEDPTRIFRAVRFAARLGFDIDSETARLIRFAVSSGVYEKARASAEKTPALQSRLTAELKNLLSESTWEGALAKAAHLGALSCIHRDIKLTPALWRQLRRMNRWLEKLQTQSFVDKFGIKLLADEPPKWLMLLELIVAQLDVPLRAQVGTALNLGESSLRRLQTLHLWEAEINQQLSTIRRPSQLASLLRSYERAVLLLIGDRHPYTLGPHIWQYIVQLSNQPSLITGRNLKQMGYRPGPQFREILTDINNLALDGKLTSAQEAEAYVAAHYSKP